MKKNIKLLSVLFMFMFIISSCRTGFIVSNGYGYDDIYYRPSIKNIQLDTNAYMDSINYANENELYIENYLIDDINYTSRIRFSYNPYIYDPYWGFNYNLGFNSFYDYGYSYNHPAYYGNGYNYNHKKHNRFNHDFNNHNNHDFNNHNKDKKDVRPTQKRVENRIGSSSNAVRYNGRVNNYSRTRSVTNSQSNNIRSNYSSPSRSVSPSRSNYSTPSRSASPSRSNYSAPSRSASPSRSDYSSPSRSSYSAPSTQSAPAPSNNSGGTGRRR